MSSGVVLLWKSISVLLEMVMWHSKCDLLLHVKKVIVTSTSLTTREWLKQGRSSRAMWYATIRSSHPSFYLEVGFRFWVMSVGQAWANAFVTMVSEGCCNPVCHVKGAAGSVLAGGPCEALWYILSRCVLFGS